jgi:hypothetical protein
VRLSWECRGDSRIAGTEKMRQFRMLDWVAHPVSRKLLVGAKVRLSWGCRGEPRIAGTEKMRQFRFLAWVIHPVSRML